MEGVTTAAVVFIFFCIAFPRLIRHRTQYYGAVVAVLLILLVSFVARVVNQDTFNRFAGAMTALLDLAAVLLLIMSSGGLSPKELFGQMGDAFQDLRHGPDAGKPVIVPLTGERPAARQRPRSVGAAGEEASRYTIDPEEPGEGD